jgi:hypothetical protein
MVVEPSSLQITITTPIVTAVTVRKRVECRRMTCTVVVVYIINATTVTQYCMVFEERQYTKETPCVSTRVTDLRPVPVSADCTVV